MSKPIPNAFALGDGDDDNEKLAPKAREPGLLEPYENMTINLAMHD